MGVSPGVWPLLGLLWLLAALPVHGRGDAFQVEEMPEKDLVETMSPSDDILDINQELILLEEPESSFLMEGDIVRVSPFRMFPFASPRWQKKEGFVQVPYIISYKYDKSSVKRIQEAFRDFEKFTCVKFVPYSSQKDFISIVPLSGCFSSVGRTGGMQVVSLAAACLRQGKAVVLHELMHVLGFWHEHCRADRDKYIRIAWEEILTGFETNFMKSWTTNMLGQYDYSSVMHYSRNAFSLRGLPTIVPLSRSCPVIGQSWNLSNSDIARVNKLYRCYQTAAQAAATTRTTAGFVPRESEFILPTSKVGILTAWSPSPVASAIHSARESLQPFSTAVEEGFSATAVHLRDIVAPGTEAHDWHMVSLETTSKAERDVTEGMLHRTQSMETESTAQKASGLQALQNVASSANQLPHHQENYTPSGQNATETIRQAVPEVALTTSSFLTSPAPLSTDVAKGTAGRPSKSILHQLLSGTRSMHTEQTEPPTSIAVESNDAEDKDSPSPAEGHSFSVMETATKEQGTVSQAVGKVGNTTSMHLMGVWAEAVSSSYPKGLEKPTLGLGHEEELEGQVYAGTELPEDIGMDGRASLLPPASPGTQMSSKPGYGVAEIPQQQPFSVSAGTHGTGASNHGLQTEAVACLKTAVSGLSRSREAIGLPYVGQTTEGLPVLSRLQWGQVATEETSQEAKGQGPILPATDMALPPSETNPSPSWVSHSGNLGEDNGTVDHPESLIGTTSAVRSDSSELVRGTPESATARNGRSAVMTHVGSTALVLEELPSSPPVGGTETPAHSGSSLLPFWDQTPGRLGNSQPENGRPFAGGRLATKEAAQEGVGWTMTQDPALEQRGFASPLLEVGSLPQKSHAVTTGMAFPHTAGSLESPTSAFHSEGLAASHPPREILFLTGLPVGATTVLQVSATPLEALEKASAATDVRADNTVSKKSREPSAETPAAGSVPLTKISRWASVVGHTATQPARVGNWQLQTKTAQLEGTAWSTSERRGEAKVMKFLFQKGTSPVMASGVRVSQDAGATDTHLGYNRLAVNRTEIPEAASTDVGPFLLRYPKSWGQSTAISGKKRSTSSSAGSTSKLTLETFGNIGPGNGRTTAMPKNYLGGEKMFPSEGSSENRNPVPVEPTKGAAAPFVGISSVHPQTLGLVEMSTSTALDQARATQGPDGQSKFLGKRTAGGMRRGQSLFPPKEASKQTSKAQTLVRLDEKTRHLITEVELQQKERPSLDVHNAHQMGKRSLPETIPTPASGLAKQRLHECEPLRWHTIHLKSRKPEAAGSGKAPLLLRKHGIGGSHPLPRGSASGCVHQIHLGNSAVSHTDGALAAKNMAARTEPTRSSKEGLAHRGRLFLSPEPANYR